MVVSLKASDRGAVYHLLPKFSFISSGAFI